jgi:hypothetical protein
MMSLGDLNVSEVAMLSFIIGSPAFVLYSLQACTYAVAGYLSYRLGHTSLAACYAISAAIHVCLVMYHIL